MSLLREPDAEPIPGYKLIEPLGSGGFGEAWKCVAPGGLFKAIKFVYGNLNSLDGDAACAEQELKALQWIKEVRHPFVLSMDRIEVLGGELIIVMELADKSLHDMFVECQSTGLVGIPRDDLLRYMRDASEALDHMFQKHHLQHLDIKPRNLFLISDRVKVADFGLVKTLERSPGSGTMMGVTPLYASPETFGGKISEHSDQYSLAIVYHELLTGQRPFNGKNVRQLAVQHMTEDPDLRALPEAERPVVARALAKDPAKRFPNCQAFVWALYKAWTPVAQMAQPGAGGSSGNIRPKSLADTMEDMQLDHRELNSPSPAQAASPAAPVSDDEVPLGEHPPAGAPAGRDGSSAMGKTIAQPQGTLRPALIIGIGGFGRRALRELRCRLLDRFGDLRKIPLLRFMYVDTDGEAVRMATRGSPDIAFGSHEVYHLPLQPAGTYRRRSLDQISEWLPREKLYAIPRSLETQGTRALGRLAFADNYMRVLGRIRRELQLAADNNNAYQSVSHTSLALRDEMPRVFVIAAAGGGGSGMIVDLGYAVRRLLQQIGHPKAEVHSFLFCGAPSDPATPAPELANIYASLTELNHFTADAMQFSAQYSADGPRLVEQGQPYGSVYVLAQPHRSPESLRDTIGHLGSYLFHDLTTPLGMRLDKGRALRPKPQASRFRGFGTYAVWFPRGLMLRLAARQACMHLLKDWQKPLPPDGPQPEALAERSLALWRECVPAPEALEARLVGCADAGLEGGLSGSLDALFSSLEEQSMHPSSGEDPGGWSKVALTRLFEFAGVSPSVETTTRRTTKLAGEWRKSRLTRTIAAAAQKLAEELEPPLTHLALEFMDLPGARFATAEAVFTALGKRCDEELTGLKRRLDATNALLDAAWAKLDEAQRACTLDAGGFRFFAARSARRQLRQFLEQIVAFGRLRLAEETIVGVQQALAGLRGKLADRVRDVAFCRQRLRSLSDMFLPLIDADLDTTPGVTEVTPSHSPMPSPESFWDTIRQSATVRVVVPDGEPDLDVAAERFVRTLRTDQWEALDQFVQDRVLHPQGGMFAALAGHNDLARNLAAPLVDQAANYLGMQMPITDVAQVEVATEGTATDLPAWIAKYYENAAPLVVGADPSNQASFLLVPASDAGTAFGTQAKAKIENLTLVRVFGQADLMFCREQGYLELAEIDRVFGICRPAYHQAAAAPLTSPHSRFDILDWVPLDS